MCRSAKEMYFFYECSEYNMKAADVLGKYKNYHISPEQQETWKNEYIEMLFNDLAISSDFQTLSKLSSFSRTYENTGILKRLLLYWLDAEKRDIEIEFSLSFSLLNAINPFAVKRKDDVAINALSILEASFGNILENSNIERTQQIAKNCCEAIIKMKKNI